jgi:hypothetical protein
LSKNIEQIVHVHFVSSTPTSTLLELLVTPPNFALRCAAPGYHALAILSDVEGHGGAIAEAGGVQALVAGEVLCVC